MTKRIVVYPGTFDPITYGHMDVIKRACELFDEVIVAVAENSKKAPLFSLVERMTLVKNVLVDLTKIEVVSLQGLLVDFVRAHQARAILRGMRAAVDFNYEWQLASMNRHLAADIETIFLMPSAEYAFISSSLVREAAMLRADVTGLVPPAVQQALKNIYL